MVTGTVIVDYRSTALSYATEGEHFNFSFMPWYIIAAFVIAITLGLVVVEELYKMVTIMELHASKLRMLHICSC